ncbi:MAG TPA: autotransporter-associated beta strand repeat-containing protein, partial [Chthoniobacteraceae bacterium]|nr:autotransporter-associated beta strand repeat-containing protein [Chthoniobacteraceae bacterium]
MFPAPAKTLRPLSLAAAVALTLAGDAHGLSDTWVGNTSVNWADLNWVGGNNPPLTGDLLFFGVAGSAGTELINNLPTPFTAAGITFNSGASPFTFTGNAITLGGNVTNNSTAFQAINFDLALGVARTFTTVAGGGNVSLGGVISGAGGVTKAGPGTLFLANPANTYTGETSFVYNGTAPSIVNVASLSNYGVPSSIGSRTAAQDFTAAQGGSISLRFQGGTLQYTGSTPQSTNREIRLLGNAGVGNINANSNAIDASGSTPEATLSFTHTGTNKNLYEAAGHRSLVLTGTNTGANSFSIRLTDQAPSPNPATTAASGLTNLIKRGPGTWYIRNTDNTYQGETIIEGGILNVASLSDYGVPSSIGSRAAVGLAGSLATAGENTTVTGVGLHFLGGTLQYTGSTPTSTNRNIRVFIGNGATLDASGSVPSATMSFTHTGGNVNLFDTPGVRTITLTGTNTGNNGFSIIIENQSGTATHLTKSGPGTWVLN